MDTRRIVVVDHDNAFLDLMHDLLTEEGYEALCWHAGDDTFTRLQAARPALAILVSSSIDATRRGRSWSACTTTRRPPTSP